MSRVRFVFTKVPITQTISLEIVRFHRQPDEDALLLAGEPRTVLKSLDVTAQHHRRKLRLEIVFWL